VSESSRGGRKIKIRVFEKNNNGEQAVRLLATSCSYPHSRGARKRYSNSLEIPLIDTGFHRPKQAISIFLNEWIDSGLTSYDVISNVLGERFNINLKRVFWDNLFKPPKETA